MKSDIHFIPTEGRRFYLVLGCLILVAWGLLISVQRSPYAELLSHEAIELDSYPSGIRWAVFMLGWSLMIVAMMLPGSLPMLNIHVRPLRQRVAGSYLTGLIILGYLFPWIVFGGLAYLGDSFLHMIFEPPGILSPYEGLIAPAIILIAGIYQLTPVKRRYNMRCRPPHALSLESGVEKPGGTGAVKGGLHLGVTCVGSCWALMLLMFALGHNRLDLMLALGCVMAAERLTPWGNRLAWLVGVALVVWGTFFMFTTLIHTA